MQLTKQTDFAFRTLIFLAQLDPDDLSQIQTICDFYAISPNHVSKVVNSLAKKGYIETIRGKGGGIRLAMQPDEINLGLVVRDMEPSLKVVNCSEPVCTISPYCKLKSVLANAVKLFVDELSTFTLADLADDQLQQTVLDEVAVHWVQDAS